MEKQSESIDELIDQATQMLLDRSPAERRLIYHLCKMPSEDRAAIVLAYQLIAE